MTEQTSRSDWAFLLAKYRFYIFIVALAAVGGMWYMDLLSHIPTWSDIPRTGQIIIVYAIYGAGITWLVYALLPALGDLIESIPFLGKHLRPIAEALRLEWLLEPDYDRYWESDVNRGFHKAAYDVPPGFDMEVERGKPFQNDAGEYCCKRLEVDEENETIHCWFHWLGEVSDEELEQFEFAQEELTKRQDYQVNKAKSVLIKLPWMLRNMEQKITERLSRQTVEKSTDSVETYDSELIRSVDKWSDDGTIPEDYMSDKYQKEREEDAGEIVDEAEEMLDDMTDGAVQELKDEVDGVPDGVNSDE